MVKSAEPWATIIGQPEAVETLRYAAVDPVHAYLFLGPRGSGKRRAARSFAAAILASDDMADPDRHVRLALDGIHPDLVEASGARIVLANSYHLFLQPGSAVVARTGGLHGFMGWSGPILTDSGGFQVFSLPGRQITEKGVKFTFEKQGKPVFMGPDQLTAPSVVM